MKILVIGDFHGKFSGKLRKRIACENPDLIVGVGDYAGIEDWRAYINYLFGLEDRTEALSAEDFFGNKKYKQLIENDFQAGKRVLIEIKKLGKPVIFIFGNGDDVWYKYPFVRKSGKSKRWAVDKRALKFVGKLGLKNITYGRTKFDGVEFAGFGGYMDVKANYSKYEKKLYNEVMRRVMLCRRFLFSNVRKMKSKDVLVLHYPPKGAFDKILDRKNAYHGKSAGIESFREAILRFKPKIALCGHMHEYQGMKKIGKTLVVNPGDAERGRFAVIDYPEMKVRFFR